MLELSMEEEVQDEAQPRPWPPKLSTAVQPMNKTGMAKFWGVATTIYIVVAAFALQLHRWMQPSASTTKDKEVISEAEDSETFSQRNWGLNLRFKDPVLEAKWIENIVKQEGLKTGSRTLFFGGIAVIMYHILRMYIAVKESCMNKYMVHNVWKLTLEIAVCGIAYLCWRRPSLPTYYGLVCYYFFYTLAMSIAPFACSCAVLLSECASTEGSVGHEQTWYVYEMINHYDCTLQGPTATMTTMTWIFILPWVILRLEDMHLVWLWLVIVYLSWTVLYIWITEENYYRPLDIGLRFLALCLALTATIFKKFQIEKPRRLAFLKDIENLSSSKGLFSILEIMMPRHVIMPRLLGNPVAEDIDRVSILFIVIDGFEGFAHRLTPTQLLNFLNERFRDMDSICARNEVTKIETVCDEYVACVGVLPEDIADAEVNGHGPMLERMFTASKEILDTQTAEVQYKMGIHTGPIVAGVIGTKLPRFRLFGNTINTAARMMQKGMVGKVQFGVETHAELPETLRGKVDYRGEVEMKGKGHVQAYLFPPDKRRGSASSARRSASGRQSLGAPEEERGAADDTEVVPPESNIVESDASPSARAAPIRRVSVLMRLIPLRQQMRADSQLAQQGLDAEAEESFQQALKQLTEDAGQHRGWAGFNVKMDHEWQRGYHTETFCRNLHLRYGEMAIAMLLIFAAELAYMLYMKAWHFDHMFYPKKYRLPIFVYSRIAALLIRSLWWYIATQSTWLNDNYAFAENVVLLSSGVILMLTWVSYDALIFSDTEKWRKEMTEFGISETQVSPDQVFSIFFALFFYLEVTNHPFRYRTSRSWLVLTVGVLFSGPIYAFAVSGEKAVKWISMYTLPGKCLFLANIGIACFVAYISEGLSRNRFKAEKTLEKTRKKTTHILDTLMPHLVLEEISSLGPGQEPKPHSYRHATIAQSDLCGFTKLSSEKRPDEVVSFMGELFGMFDDLTDKYDVYKVETVGDAYIAGMAERPLTEKNIPVNVVLFALDMVRAVDRWAQNLGVNVTCRCGIHYGECIGGVVGTGMQRYHLFGGLMAVVEVMESTAPEGRVQVSRACKLEVERYMREDESSQLAFDEKIGFDERSEPDLRTSKGEVHTYEEVNGRTFVVTSSKALRVRSRFGSSEST